MKRITILLVLLISFTLAKSQTFKLGVLFYNGIWGKIDGKIEVTDSIVTLKYSYKDISESYEFDFVKKANNIIYITDGVMTNSMTVMNQTGKKKGFEFNRLISFKYDKRLSNVTVMYYAKILDKIE